MPGVPWWLPLFVQYPQCPHIYKTATTDLLFPAIDLGL